MAKKPEPKPLFSLKADFIASLDHYTLRAGMLADSVGSILSINRQKKFLPDGVAEILEKNLNAYMDASSENE